MKTFSGRADDREKVLVPDTVTDKKPRRAETRRGF
jgi:hypothetical protein